MTCTIYILAPKYIFKEEENEEKIISALVVANDRLMLIGCGSGKDGSGSSNSGGEERVWKFAHTRAEGTENDVIARDFADNLTSSIDNLKIDIYPNNQRRLYRGAGSYRNERSSIDVWLYVANGRFHVVCANCAISCFELG